MNPFVSGFVMLWAFLFESSSIDYLLSLDPVDVTI